ncbi:MAG: sugar phosphate isomerase/epimerase [Alphaproteobacteria bacterium]|nr:sugar phosphate isomerase/epimerase [Alphaproteobacteria bacterium]
MNPLVLAPTTLMNAPPLAFLHAASEAGYDGVGLRLYRSPNLPFFPVVGDAALIRDMKALIETAGLDVLDIFTFYLLPETRVVDFRAALELGAWFGARYAVVQGNDPDPSRLRDNFTRTCDMANELGLTIVVEFVPARWLSTLAAAVRLLEQAARRNVGICIDPLHLVGSRGSAAELRRVDRRLLPYAQFCDGRLAPGEPDPALGRTRPGERALPGEGNLPLDDILDALPEGIPLSLEVLRPENWSGSDTEWARLVLMRSRDYLASRPRRRSRGGSRS